jgi:glucosamine--fructose-6-phosphate aminotransferase (isomerizing)
MCGIIGIINNNECIDYLLHGLKQLQNRGYDSAGICTVNDNGGFVIRKYASENISALIKLEDAKHVFNSSTIGIGHTRWATHGGKTDKNSHPHMSSDGLFVIVHNGIIENYSALKDMLLKNGYSFISETDSEVIANLLSYNYKQLGDENIEKTIKQTIKQLEGTWGLCILCINTPNHLYCTRNGSPILIGLTNDYAMVVSEQSGFDININDYIVLNNYDICSIVKENGEINITTKHQYTLNHIKNKSDCFSCEPYLHWTIKEIYEQNISSLRAISFGGRLLTSSSVKLGGLDMNINKLKNIDNLILLGCGTSYNAGMCGINYFKELCNFNCVQLFDGADFNEKDIPKYGKTALILLSQSGETKDLHRCIKLAENNNLFTIGVVNVVDSLIAREVDCGCYLNAGKEVAVASTKSFTSQCILLSMIAIWFSQIHNINNELRNKYVEDLKNLNTDICDMLNDLETKIEQFVSIFEKFQSCFVLGKGNCESIAREGSLKIKEISYIHCESYSTSSLKHGPFALLCEKFPVILIAPNDEHLTKNINAYHEIKSRDANILIITNDCVKEFENEQNVIYIPFNQTYNNILSVIPMQMLAYKLSVTRGINPDMPKNLAKVVTVE